MIVVWKMYLFAERSKECRPDYDCFIVENVTCEYCGVFVSNFVNYGYGFLQIILYRQIKN